MVVLLIRDGHRDRCDHTGMTEPHHAVITRLSADFAAMSQQLARVSADLTELDRLLAEQPPAPHSRRRNAASPPMPYCAAAGRRTAAAVPQPPQPALPPPPPPR